MNFKELRQEVNSALDYNPDLAAYRAQVSRVLNRHYIRISAQYPWLFLQKATDMFLKAKVDTGTNGSITIAATNSRRIVGSGTAFDASWEGQTFLIGTTEYTVGKVLTATSMYLTSPADTVSGSTNWSVEFRRYPLPSQCSEILGIMSRSDDRGRLMFIDRRKEEEHYLDRDTTGDPILFIEDDHLMARAPIEAPNLVVGTAGATPVTPLKNSNEYEYCYTFDYEGIESPPSLVATATTNSTGNPQITIDNLEDTQWWDVDAGGGSGALQPSGKYKNIYRRDKTNSGRWIRIASVNSTLKGFIDDEILIGNSGETGKLDVWNHDDYAVLASHHPVQYIRAWYTAVSDLNVEIRYAASVRRLQADFDVPEWPVQYHHLLVYKSLEDICLKHGMVTQSQLYERRAREMLRSMKDKWLARQARQFIRRGFDDKLFQSERWGTPSKA